MGSGASALTLTNDCDWEATEPEPEPEPDADADAEPAMGMGMGEAVRHEALRHLESGVNEVALKRRLNASLGTETAQAIQNAVDDTTIDAVVARLRRVRSRRRRRRSVPSLVRCLACDKDMSVDTSTLAQRAAHLKALVLHHESVQESQGCGLRPFAYISDPQARSAREWVTGFVYDAVMELHCEPGSTEDMAMVNLPELNQEPERPGRTRCIRNKLVQLNLIPGTGQATSTKEDTHKNVVMLSTRLATRDELCLVHQPSQLDTVDHLSALSRSVASVDARDEDVKGHTDWTQWAASQSLYFNQFSSLCASHAVGGVVDMCCQIANGSISNGFAAVRPPGHHCEACQPMGFCMYNTVATAAKHLTSHGLANRVLIIDWDVHHGNGTQHMLWDNENIMYASIHRFDRGRFYPGGQCGDIDACGPGKTNVNVAWGSSVSYRAKRRDGSQAARHSNVVQHANESNGSRDAPSEEAGPGGKSQRRSRRGKRRVKWDANVRVGISAGSADEAEEQSTEGVQAEQGEPGKSEQEQATALQQENDEAGAGCESGKCPHLWSFTQESSASACGGGDIGDTTDLTTKGNTWHWYCPTCSACYNGTPLSKDWLSAQKHARETGHPFSITPTLRVQCSTCGLLENEDTFGTPLEPVLRELYVRKHGKAVADVLYKPKAEQFDLEKRFKEFQDSFSKALSSLVESIGASLGALNPGNPEDVLFDEEETSKSAHTNPQQGQENEAPQSAGSRRIGDAEYLFAFQQVVLPAARRFQPDLILVSCGFDAARGDPLGHCDVTPAAYGLMTRWLQDIPSCQGRVGVILEGGYNLDSIANSSVEIFRALRGDAIDSICTPMPKMSAVSTIAHCQCIQDLPAQPLQGQTALEMKRRARPVGGATQEPGLESWAKGKASQMPPKKQKTTTNKKQKGKKT